METINSLLRIAEQIRSMVDSIRKFHGRRQMPMAAAIQLRDLHDKYEKVENDLRFFGYDVRGRYIA